MFEINSNKYTFECNETMEYVTITFVILFVI